ncbi:MAG: apolipoprotein N-acyltransferase [Parcubacteria group bacterium Gr01-1014_49]|nr:MAG: apolipoprotein N-acyltransferase [Parcubacteria group bacterium Gr01-1014_49]
MYNERFPYALPVLSALLLVITLPPFNLWPFVLVALVPLYLFILREKSLFKISAGALFLGLIFSGYIFSITLAGFNWIPQAHLFSTLVKWMAIPIVLLISIASALALCLFGARKERLVPLERVIFFGTFFAVTQWVISYALMGFNYGSLAYPAIHIPALRFIAGFGGAFLVTFAVAFGNAALAEALRFLAQKDRKDFALLAPVCVFVVIVGMSSAYQYLSLLPSTSTSSSLSVAIIQDSTRKESEAFGEVVDGTFQFPLLEQYMKEAAALHPDIIIYPFSPWEGVISAKLDNSAFNTNIIGMDFATFGKWLSTHVPRETTLVTWNTHLENGIYWNDIDFWKDGALVASHQKTHLFPFMDYTPQWSQQLGVYSLPYDGTAGTSTAPIEIGGVSIGNLVCSEVALPESALENGKDADVLFAIGSEAMFSSPIPSEFNLLNAQLRAAELGRMVIRANKFGPSALVDSRGNIVNELARDESGILFVTVPVQTKRTVTLYSRVTEYPFLILLLGYTLFLIMRKPARERAS